MPRQVFTADNRVHTPLHVARAMLRGAVQARYMGYRLAVRSIKARYAKSAFGLVWDLVDPLVLGLIFYMLMVYRVIQPGDMPMPYATFIIYGLLLYATFVEALTQALDIFAHSRGLLTQVKMPPEAMLISVALVVGFNSLFRLLIMLGFSLALQVYAADHHLASFSLPGFLKFLLLYPLVILSGLSIGLALAPFNAIYADVGRVTRIVLTPLRYLSPILWPLPATGAFAAMAWLNPVASLVGDLRLLAATNTMATPGPFFAWCGGLALLFLFAWYVFHVAVPVLAERA